jgi:hypothetical protein
VSVKDGGPAFPGGLSEKDGAAIQGGMSLRDYFAAKAMQAEMITTFSDATPQSADAFIKGCLRDGHTAEEHLASNAYKVADAMLKAREATHG